VIRAELRNYAVALWALIKRHKVITALLAVVVLLLGQWRPAHVVLAMVLLALTVAGLRWRYRDGQSLEAHHFRKWQRGNYAFIASVWPELMIRLGLSVRSATGTSELPIISGAEWNGYSVGLLVRLPLGMRRESVTSAAAAIAESFGAASVSVEAAPGGALVVVSYADPLSQTVFVEHPGDHVDIRAVPMGLQASGAPWTFRVGPHTLVAGSSGSGKGSMLWSLLTGLGPAIRAGLVEVRGIDLKGGMELAIGKGLFTQYAIEPEAAVILLERACGDMRDRANRLAGHVREHTANVESPHVLVVIDELAALTAYQTDRDLQRRANAALAILCSQGRAPGFTVFACLQDPRKETLPVRGLFTQTIGLRLRDALETSMVLGEGMREKGALCHHIPPTLPGVAYVIPEDGGDPVRVRASYASDEVIRWAATTYEAPRHEVIQVPTAAPSDTDAPSPRSTRARRNRKTGEES
jgi:S-DNA-T family DNA segregation ATPase FtsK/SpoIIIE